jgi:hypothetical protein
MAAGVKHYTKDGKEYKGAMHKHPDGKIMTGKTHTKSSKPLFHAKDFKKKTVKNK